MIGVRPLSEHRQSTPPDKVLANPVGIGLRHPHYQDLIETQPDIGWIEVHPENYFGGGAPLHFLRQACKTYPLSLHAVGLSLGSDQPVSETHLQKFKALIDEFQPFHVSDHASWSASGNAHLNDLLPLPYTQETLDTLCRNVDQTQTYFGRTILVENPSSYVSFAQNEMSETAFMNALAEKTGCGILLDINNIFVQSFNHGFDAFEYIDEINSPAVGEMHLAGHTEKDLKSGGKILIDTHNRPVRMEVWDLYEYALRKLGPIPTLIEWDQDFPAWSELIAEAHRARDIMMRMQSERLAHAAE